MITTDVVFVHGFTSSPKCWDPFVERLESDRDIQPAGFHLIRFQYPTAFLEIDWTERIPTIAECANYLGDFLNRECKSDQLMLVGHSMGGLVIQSLLAQKLTTEKRGLDLKRIRSVILFATPNRGSTMLENLRGIFSFFRKNPQDEGLQVLDKEIADTSDIIVRSVLDAKGISEVSCPIPFRVFWGLKDNVVPEVSARGPFLEASGLPGDHSGIIQCDPNDPDDQRYAALKDALLNPIGHPAIYEIDLFDVKLKVSPVSTDTKIALNDMADPQTIQTDNVALREITIKFAKQNRCCEKYNQFYRSDNGWVECVSHNEPNEADSADMSTYFKTGKSFLYLFTPDRDKTFSMKLQIYGGYGEGQRTWHNHMKENARYKLFCFTLNLKDYEAKGYELATSPSLYYHAEDVYDHKLSANRLFDQPLPCVESKDPWLRTWEVTNVRGGVIDIVWDFKPLTQATK